MEKIASNAMPGSFLEANLAYLPVNVSALPDARFRRTERRRGVPRASGKAVCTWPLAMAVDAGPMQIQLWEGAALRCAGAAPQRAIHDTKCE